jgi:hypothetical protein
MEDVMSAMSMPASTPTNGHDPDRADGVARRVSFSDISVAQPLPATTPLNGGHSVELRHLPSPASAVDPLQGSANVRVLEAIRDQWLLPLIDRIGALERELGRLQFRATYQDGAIADLEAERAALLVRVRELEGSQPLSTAPSTPLGALQHEVLALSGELRILQMHVDVMRSHGARQPERSGLVDRTRRWVRRD